MGEARLAGLTTRQFKVYSRVFSGHAPADVAANFGMTPQAVREMVRRALIRNPALPRPFRQRGRRRHQQLSQVAPMPL